MSSSSISFVHFVELLSSFELVCMLASICLAINLVCGLEWKRKWKMEDEKWKILVESTLQFNHLFGLFTFLSLPFERTQKLFNHSSRLSLKFYRPFLEFKWTKEDEKGAFIIYLDLMIYKNKHFQQTLACLSSWFKSRVSFLLYICVYLSLPTA